MKNKVYFSKVPDEWGKDTAKFTTREEIMKGETGIWLHDPELKKKLKSILENQDEE